MIMRGLISSRSGFVVDDDGDTLDDCYLDGCSICLEPFTAVDPPSVSVFLCDL